MWKLDANGILKNKANTTIDGSGWAMTETSTEEYKYIRSGDQVLGLQGSAEDGVEVKLEDKEATEVDKQLWKKSSPDTNGWFTLKSKENPNMLLHANSQKKMSIGTKSFTPPEPTYPDSNITLSMFYKQRL